MDYVLDFVLLVVLDLDYEVVDFEIVGSEVVGFEIGVDSQIVVDSEIDLVLDYLQLENLNIINSIYNQYKVLVLDLLIYSPIIN